MIASLFTLMNELRVLLAKSKVGWWMVVADSRKVQSRSMQVISDECLSNPPGYRDTSELLPEFNTIDRNYQALMKPTQNEHCDSGCTERLRQALTGYDARYCTMLVMTLQHSGTSRQRRASGHYARQSSRANRCSSRNAYRSVEICTHLRRYAFHLC